MELSNKLLSELSKWPIKQVPSRFYHGCCHGDAGLDLSKNLISGNKWFSIDPFYAGEYGWHWSRPALARRARLELELIHTHFAIEHTTYLEEDWAPFLADCFPGIYGYDLSRKFQDTLAAHLEKLGIPNLYSYISNGGKEICIPKVERFVRIISVMDLPNELERYRQLRGSI